MMFDEMYSELADCMVLGSSSRVGAVRKCGWARGRVRAAQRRAGGNGGVGLRPQHWPSTGWAAPLARGCHCAPWALRGRPRDGGALSPLCAWCAPPPLRCRRSLAARACRFAPGVLRGRLRADAALPSRAATALRVVRRPRAGDAPPPAKLAVPTARCDRISICYCQPPRSSRKGRYRRVASRTRDFPHCSLVP